MPYKPKIPCRYPGCPQLIEPGQQYCDKHKSQNPERERSKVNKKIYNSRWQKASKTYLAEHPLCAACLKESPPRYTKATVVDHITPHRGDMKLFWDRSNWQPLCKRCHDRKTLTEDIHPTYRY